jgi:site-specific DNA recombinase
MDGVLVCRVSDPRQEDRFSLDAQEREGTAYAREHGIDLVAKFVFQETASKAQQRRKFQEIVRVVMERSSAKPIALLAEKHDRLYRNHQNSADVQLLIESGRIVVHFWKLGKTLDRYSDPSEFLVDDVMTSVNQYQARRIGREAIKGMTERALQGWLPGRAPLGYRNEDRAVEGHRSGRDSTESIIVPDPAALAWVRLMFELRAGGLSFAQIRDRCLAAGVVPAERRDSFRANFVEKVIKNPFYRGAFDWRGTRYEGQHELIVDPELVDRALGIDVSSTLRKRKHDGALVGWLRCGECGCAITYEPKRKGERVYAYYRCANGRRAHERLQYADEGRILEAFGPALDAITLTEERAREVATALNRAHQKAQGAKREQLDGFRASLAALEHDEDELYQDLKRDVLDDEGYRRQLARVRAERQRYTGLLEQAQAAIDGAYLVTAQRILELATRARSLWNERSALERRQFLDRLLSNPTWDGATARWDWRKPWGAVARIGESSNWRPFVEDFRTEVQQLRAA